MKTSMILAVIHKTKAVVKFAESEKNFWPERDLNP